MQPLCGSIPYFNNFIAGKNLDTMDKTGKKSRFLTLFAVVLIILHAGSASAMATHSVHIEWDYDPYTAPVNEELSSYRLYKEGVQVCQFDTPYAYEGDCEFMSDSGLYNFSLTAVFADGTESPLSTAIPFLLGPGKNVNAGAILAVINLLLGT